MMSCKETAHLVSQRLVGRLSFWQRWSVRMHLLMCDACATFRRQIVALNALLARRLSGQVPEGDASLPRLDDAARERIRAALRRREEQPPGADGAHGR